ncbi:Spc98 family-domain-containing protein [Tribonema minus]|uniref:Spc98 family-domain-containing protein n=1 Tax=Tribonema minus TaxID=303371 RepID=A0A835YN81_9STRA|nr:Spc98 family-domain-containing protein [Tribonema minus]
MAASRYAQHLERDRESAVSQLLVMPSIIGLEKHSPNYNEALSFVMGAITHHNFIDAETGKVTTRVIDVSEKLLLRGRSDDSRRLLALEAPDEESDDDDAGLEAWQQEYDGECGSDAEASGDWAYELGGAAAAADASPMRQQHTASPIPNSDETAAAAAAATLQKPTVAPLFSTAMPGQRQQHAYGLECWEVSKALGVSTLLSSMAAGDAQQRSPEQVPERPTAAMQPGNLLAQLMLPRAASGGLPLLAAAAVAPVLEAEAVTAALQMMQGLQSSLFAMPPHASLPPRPFRLAAEAPATALLHLSPLALRALVQWATRLGSDAEYLRAFVLRVRGDGEAAIRGEGGGAPAPRFGAVACAFAEEIGRHLAEFEHCAARLERGLYLAQRGRGPQNATVTLMGLKAKLNAAARHLRQLVRLVEAAVPAWWVSSDAAAASSAHSKAASSASGRALQAATLLDALCNGLEASALVTADAHSAQQRADQGGPSGRWRLHLLAVALQPYLCVLSRWLHPHQSDVGADIEESEDQPSPTVEVEVVPLAAPAAATAIGASEAVAPAATPETAATAALNQQAATPQPPAEPATTPEVPQMPPAAASPPPSAIHMAAAADSAAPPPSGSPAAAPAAAASDDDECDWLQDWAAVSSDSGFGSESSDDETDSEAGELSDAELLPQRSTAEPAHARGKQHAAVAPPATARSTGHDALAAVAAAGAAISSSAHTSGGFFSGTAQIALDPDAITRRQLHPLFTMGAPITDSAAAAAAAAAARPQSAQQRRHAAAQALATACAAAEGAGGAMPPVVVLQRALHQPIAEHCSAVSSACVRLLLRELRLLDVAYCLRSLYVVGTGQLLDLYCDASLSMSVAGAAGSSAAELLSHTLLGTDAPLSTHVKVVIDGAASTSGDGARSLPTDFNLLRALKLHCALPAFYGCLLGPQTLDKYATAHALVMQIKYALHVVSCEHTAQQKALRRRGAPAAAQRRAHLLLYAVLQFVRALHEYTAMQTADVHWQALTAQAAEAQSPRALAQVHDAHVSALLLRLFLQPSHAVVLGYLLGALEASVAYTRHCSQFFTHEGSGDDYVQQQQDGTAVSMQQAADRFYTSVQFATANLQQHKYAGGEEHVEQLLISLTFNAHYGTYRPCVAGTAGSAQ